MFEINKFHRTHVLNLIEVTNISQRTNLERHEDITNKNIIYIHKKLLNL